MAWIMVPGEVTVYTYNIYKGSLEGGKKKLDLKYFRGILQHDDDIFFKNILKATRELHLLELSFIIHVQA